MSTDTRAQTPDETRDAQVRFLARKWNIPRREAARLLSTMTTDQETQK